MAITNMSDEYGAAAEPAAPADQAADDDWLAAEVQEALSDPSPGIPHEEAMRPIRAAVFAK